MEDGESIRRVSLVLIDAEVPAIDDQRGICLLLPCIQRLGTAIKGDIHAEESLIEAPDAERLDLLVLVIVDWDHAPLQPGL